MDQIASKVFSAWIVPGIIIPPVVLKRAPEMAMQEIFIFLCTRHGIQPHDVPIKSNVGNKKPIGSTLAISYIRQMFCYFMKDIYKDNITLAVIAKQLNFRTHYAVLHCIKTFAGHIEQNSIIPRTLGIDTVRHDYFQFNQDVRPWL